MLKSFETIVDYRNRRLILIRLDKTGHRLVQVPAYKPRKTFPMPDMPRNDYGWYNTTSTWWSIAVRPDKTLDTLNTANNTEQDIIDTGAAGNTDDIVGFPFLSPFGVVGFNPILHQFILYQ